MKKLIVTVLMMVGMISMVGCSDAPKTAEKMYIEPAQLTEEVPLIDWMRDSE